MTDPRIEATARELKRLFSEGDQAGDAMWLSCAKCVLDAADAAAWRPFADRPPAVPVLVMSRHGAVVAQWDAKIDGWRNEDTMYSPRYFTHWRSLPPPPNAEASPAPKTITIPEVRNDRPIPVKGERHS